MTSANLGFLKFNQCAFHQAHIILLLTTTPHSAGEGSSWRTLNSFYVRPLATWSLGVRVFNYLFDPYSQWWVDLGTHTQHYTRRRRKEDNHNPRYSIFLYLPALTKIFLFSDIITISGIQIVCAVMWGTEVCRRTFFPPFDLGVCRKAQNLINQFIT